MDPVDNKPDGSASGVRTTRRTRPYPISFYFAVLAILLAVATCVGVWFARSAAVDQATSDARGDAVFAATEAAEEISSSLSALEQQLVVTAGSPAMAGVLAAPEDCTLTFTGVGPFTQGHLDVLDVDGEVACTSLTTAEGLPAGQSREYVGADWLASVANEPATVGPLVDARTGSLAIAHVVPIPDVGGFMVAFMDLASLGPGLADRFGGRLGHEFVIVADDTGVIVARSDAADRWVGEPARTTSFADPGGDRPERDVDGVARIYGESTVPELGWRVFAGSARDDALQGATSAFQRALVVIASAFVLVLLIGGVFYRRIAGPITSLSRAVRSQAADRPHARISAGGPAEVVAVADEFNEVVASLHRELLDRERAEQAVRDSERTYRTLFEDNPQPMWVWDTATHYFLEVNDAAVAHYGYTRDEFLAMKMVDIVGPGGDGLRGVELLLEQLSDRHLMSPLHRSGPWRHITRDRGEIAVEVTSHTIQYRGRSARFALSVDVTARLAYESQLQHLAVHDELTGLPNRTLLLDRLATALAHAQHHHTMVAVLYVDLDRLTPVNDVHGRDEGDAVLQTFATRLSESAAPDETVARISGDEFVVMCPEVSGATEAISVAGRIEGLLAQPFVVGGVEVFLTASIGVIMSSGGDVPDELVRDAQAAMRRAKERGGDRFEMFDDEIRSQALVRVQTGHELRQAIQADELCLHFQPEIDFRTGTCTGVEALVRWNHPTRGLLAPIHFIPIAEETGLIVPLGRWVLRAACRQAAAWRKAGTGPPSVSVNLSAREIAQPDLVGRVSEALDQAGLDPSGLRLEITETSIMDDPEGAAEVLASLRDLGVRLDIDDFGTGYSSLLYLRRFAVDYLKIDRSFVAGIGENQQDDAIVASVIDLAHAFDLGVVAEGVETVAQADWLERMGCDLGQGFLWARPVPAAELPRVLRHVATMNRNLRRIDN
jgi:diguanylate cyclase (GGDEF)-like protein/PAS domain S-box-containing protein